MVLPRIFSVKMMLICRNTYPRNAASLATTLFEAEDSPHAQSRVHSSSFSRARIANSQESSSSPIVIASSSPGGVPITNGDDDEEEEEEEEEEDPPGLQGDWASLFGNNDDSSSAKMAGMLLTFLSRLGGCRRECNLRFGVGRVLDSGRHPKTKNHGFH